MWKPFSVLLLTFAALASSTCLPLSYLDSGASKWEQPCREFDSSELPCMAIYQIQGSQRNTKVLSSSHEPQERPSVVRMGSWTAQGVLTPPNTIGDSGGDLLAPQMSIYRTSSRLKCMEGEEGGEMTGDQTYAQRTTPGDGHTKKEVPFPSVGFLPELILQIGKLGYQWQETKGK